MWARPVASCAAVRDFMVPPTPSRMPARDDMAFCCTSRACKKENGMSEQEETVGLGGTQLQTTGNPEQNPKNHNIHKIIARVP